MFIATNAKGLRQRQHDRNPDRAFVRFEFLEAILVRRTGVLAWCAACNMGVALLPSSWPHIGERTGCHTLAGRAWCTVQRVAETKFVRSKVCRDHFDAAVKFMEEHIMPNAERDNGNKYREERMFKEEVRVGWLWRLRCRWGAAGGGRHSPSLTRHR